MSIAREPLRPIELLLVEDNPGDARLIAEALREGKINNRLTIVPDGAQAIAYCRREGMHAAAIRPDLILLDLNLPKRDGREVLAILKGDAELKRIPVIVLTTSHSDEDVLRAYDLSANCYITKPVDFDVFLGAVRSVESFWLSVATLPPR